MFHLQYRSYLKAMTSDYTTLGNLQKEREDFTIRVKLIRKWKALNTKFNNDLISIDLILLDQQVIGETFYNKCFQEKVIVNRTFRCHLQNYTIHYINNNNTYCRVTIFMPQSEKHLPTSSKTNCRKAKCTIYPILGQSTTNKLTEQSIIRT